MKSALHGRWAANLRQGTANQANRKAVCGSECPLAACHVRLPVRLLLEWIVRPIPVLSEARRSGRPRGVGTSVTVTKSGSAVHGAREAHLARFLGCELRATCPRLGASGAKPTTAPSSEASRSQRATSNDSVHHGQRRSTGVPYSCGPPGLGLNAEHVALLRQELPRLPSLLRAQNLGTWCRAG